MANQHLIELRAQIQFLALRGCIPDSARHWDAMPAQDATYWANVKAVVQPWQTAIEALATDADTPLPQP